MPLCKTSQGHGTARQGRGTVYELGRHGTAGARHGVRELTIKDVPGSTSYRSPESSCVSSERNSVFPVASSITRKLLLEIHSPVNELPIWKELTSRETVL
jgi:hypothetical protein